MDTTGIEPMSHAQDVMLRLREDAVKETDQRELFQSVAPLTGSRLYLVPKVIEYDSGCLSMSARLATTMIESSLEAIIRCPGSQADFQRRTDPTLSRPYRPTEPATQRLCHRRCRAVAGTAQAADAARAAGQRRVAERHPDCDKDIFTAKGWRTTRLKMLD